MCAPKAHAGDVTVRWKDVSGTATAKDATTIYRSMVTTNAWLITQSRKTTLDISKAWSSSNPTIEITVDFDKPSFSTPPKPYTDQNGNKVAGAVTFLPSSAAAKGMVDASNAQVKVSCVPEVVWTGAPGEKPPARVALVFGANASAQAIDELANTSTVGGVLFPSAGRWGETVKAKVTLGDQSFDATPVGKRSASISRSLVVLVPLKEGGTNANGQKEWVGKGPTISYEAQADIVGDRYIKTMRQPAPYPGVPTLPYYDQYEGSVNASGSPLGQAYQMDVFISSSIEKSWKKGGPGPLPDIYKKLDPSGKSLYASEQVAGQNTPTDTSDDVWKLECIRNDDGSMVVHSAQSKSIFNDQWAALHTLQANLPGFPQNSNVTCEYQGPGDNYDAPVGQRLSWISSDPTQARLRLAFGKTKPTNKSGTVTVKATMPDRSVSLSNTYDILWHLPQENWKNVGPDTRLPSASQPLITNGGNKIGDVLSYKDLSKHQEFNLGGALGIAGAVAGGYEGAYFFAAGMTALAEPEVPALIFLSAALSGASVVAGTPPEDKPIEVPNSPTSYDSYKAAVTDQESQGNYPDGTPRFTPTTDINKAKASFKPQMFTDNNNPDDDDNFARFGVTVSGKVVVDKLQENWRAESYGTNGFQGFQPGTFNRTSAPYFRIKFSHNGSTPQPTSLLSSTPANPGA